MYFMLIKLKYLVFLEEIKPLNGAETSLINVVAVYCVLSSHSTLSLAVRLHDSISEEGFHYLVFDL